MNIEGKKKVIVINSLLVAALFGLVSLNKEIIRPALSNTIIANILSGCFPNFIAAYLISLAFVNGVLTRKPKYGRFIVYISSIVIFAILTFEELRPIWGASTHYDSFDILASGIGSLLAVLTYELILLKRRNKDGRGKSSLKNNI